MSETPSYLPRAGDLPREELVKRAEAALKEWGEGAEIHFKFTCQWCGARCILDEPNRLYENGECCECGKVTRIDVGGFLIKSTLYARQAQKES